MTITKIVSGGQTGVDQAGLEVAIHGKILCAPGSIATAVLAQGRSIR